LGLSVPKASQIVSKLISYGVPVNREIYTIEQLRQALKELKDGGAVHA